MNLANRIFNYLSRKKNRAGTEPEICGLFFQAMPNHPGVSHTMLQSVLRLDGRFYYDDRNGLWFVNEDMLSIRLPEAEYCIIDIETTGFNRQFDRIIEIGAVKIVDGELYSKMDLLINPERPVPFKITQLTGLAEEMLVDKQPFHEIVPALMEYIGSSVLVAHHSDFDLGFINASLQRCGHHPLDNITLCSCKIARRLFPSLQSHSLDSVAKYLDLSFTARHRAYDDALVTAHLFQKCLNALQKKGVNTLRELKYFV
ncbi:MAG: 3'-5' exonuclease [Candidatus Auribacterota bacterium]